MYGLAPAGVLKVCPGRAGVVGIVLGVVRAAAGRRAAGNGRVVEKVELIGRPRRGSYGIKGHRDGGMHSVGAATAINAARYENRLMSRKPF